MSTNPFMDYQDQFFKMWNENMDKMMKSDAYKSMTQNIPGADAYAKAMESMVPNIEKYWKSMASAMPTMPQMPGMDYWTKMMTGNPYMDFWKNGFSSNPYMDFWTKMMDSNPYMDAWKKMTENAPDVTEFWKDPQNLMPALMDYWKSATSSFPGMNNYWDFVAKMMPNPSMFNAAGFQMPGFDAFQKVFDLWKSLGNSNAVVEDFQRKYYDTTAEIIRNLFPVALQPFAMRPMEFMKMMVEYYKDFVSPWVEIDPEIMKRIAEGDTDAYIDFFKEYQVKYEEELEKYFTMMSFGLNREATEDYMKYINQGNKAMISMGELMAVIMKTSKESFDQIADKVKADIEDGKTITTFRDFYTEWYTVTEAAFEKLLATDEFAAVFGDYADRYAQFMIAQNKVYERMLSALPIPTNTDMKSLYKTVYDLRKDVRDLKKAVAGMASQKGAE